jgi:hypothetical protein
MWLCTYMECVCVCVRVYVYNTYVSVHVFSDICAQIGIEVSSVQ